jgi:lincosamide nucleotidyltransferase A/C/D/E
VDVHPVVFDATGRGRQADLGGGHFDYPPEAFDRGSLDAVRVPCLSRDQQLLFHTGYEHRAIDLLDLAMLERLTSRG